MIPIKEYNREQLCRICNDGKDITKDKSGYASLISVDDGRVLKLYHRGGGENEFVSRDIETLLMICDSAAQFDEHYLVPTEIIICEGMVEGYYMPYVKGKRLSQASKTSSTEVVFRWFEKIFEDIISVSKMRVPFSFGDLHEDNVLVDEDGRIYHCDMDGWRILGNKGKQSRYLNMIINTVGDIERKYPREAETRFFLTDVESDIACLIIMLMNYLMQSKMSFAELPYYDLVRYLEYLKAEGVNNDFIHMIRCVYNKDDNWFSQEIIKDLPQQMDIFSYHSYKKDKSAFRDDDEAEAFINQHFGEYRYIGDC